MTSPTQSPREATARDLFFFAHPQHWPTWPFLPVVRRHADSSMDCGVLYDALHATGRTGYSSTVLLALCGTPHKQSYADWWTMWTLLNVLERSAGFFSCPSGSLVLQTPRNK